MPSCYTQLRIKKSPINFFFMKQEGLPPTDYNILRKIKQESVFTARKFKKRKKRGIFFCKITQGLLAILS